jgi:DNA-binding PadR family transcriptional regulator
MTAVPAISAKEQNVLEQLDDKPKYGLDLVADSNGVLSRSTLYVLLSNMEDRGLIRGREVPDGTDTPRRFYTITMFGAKMIHVYR